jgi:hypothetical protein
MSTRRVLLNLRVRWPLLAGSQFTGSNFLFYLMGSSEISESKLGFSLMVIDGFVIYYSLAFPQQFAQVIFCPYLSTGQQQLTSSCRRD